MRAHLIAQPRWAKLPRDAAGFTNAELAIGVALVAVLMLLTQIQSGEIAFMSAAKPAAAESKKGSGKQPEFLPVKLPQPVNTAAIQFVETRMTDLKADQQRLRNVSRSIAHMEPDKAVLLLGALDPGEAAAVLARLDSHYIAHIFEAASYQESSQWLTELLVVPEYPPIPEQYRREAEEAGLIEPIEGSALDETSDPVDGSVDEAGNGIGGTETAPAEETANGGVAPGGQPPPTANGGADPGFDVA